MDNEMGFWNVDGSYAYAVISGALTMERKEQSHAGQS